MPRVAELIYAGQRWALASPAWGVLTGFLARNRASGLIATLIIEDGHFRWMDIRLHPGIDLAILFAPGEKMSVEDAMRAIGMTPGAGYRSALRFLDRLDHRA